LLIALPVIFSVEIYRFGWNNTDINTLTAWDRYFGDMTVAAPTWFTDEYLGIEIEQYIGFGLLAIIITV